MPPYPATRPEDDDEGGSFDNLDAKLGELGDLVMDSEKKGKNKLAPLARGTACSVCRKRKLRCNGARPACASCARLGHDCVYGDRIQEELQERNRELEDEISSLRRELAESRGADAGAVNAHELPSQMKRPAQPTGFPSFNVPHQTDPFHMDPLPIPRHPHPSGSRSINIQHEVVPRMPFYNIPHVPRGHVSPSQAPLPYQTFSNGRPGLVAASYMPSTQSRSSFPSLTLPHHAQSPISHRSILHEHGGGRRMDDPLPPTPPGSGPGFGSIDDTDSNRMQWVNSAPSPKTWTVELPDPESLNTLMNLYFTTSHIHLPFLQRSRFLQSISNLASLGSAPSLSLVFAILAISAPYHNDPSVRARSDGWYTQSKESLDRAVLTGLSAEGGKGSLTVEMVQTMLLLAMVEMGRGEHQKAFLSVGQASRIVSMLGLTRLDEDRIHQLENGGETGRRLRPPALHHLPDDPVSLEECRRTVCAVFVLDRFESGCVGWPVSLSEASLRLLLPCEESLFQDGTCQASDNPLWWPRTGTLQEEEEGMGPVVDGYAWLCRIIWLGGRVQEQSYRPSGTPAVGPFQLDRLIAPMEDTEEVIHMDRQLTAVYDVLHRRYSLEAHKEVDSPGVMALIVLNCLFLNVHHLRVALGLSSLPFDPEGPIMEGSPEWSMQRCLDGTRRIHDIVAQLCAVENYSTVAVETRVTPLTTFLPYLLYCIAFAARFAIGDWTLLGKCQARVENLSGTLSTSHPSPPDFSSTSASASASTGPSMPSGDDVFGPSMDRVRLDMIDAMCEGLDRMGCVWETGNKFVQLVRMDRDKFMARSMDRQLSRPLPPSLQIPHHHGGPGTGHLLDRTSHLQGDGAPASHLASPGY